MLAASVVASHSAHAETPLCDAGQQPPEVIVEADRISICGVLQRDMIPSVAVALSDAGRRMVRVESVGGHLLHTLELAKLINANGVELEFTGLCGSACVSLFVTADRVRVGPIAIFITHQTTMGLADISISAFPGDVELEDQRRQETADVQSYWRAGELRGFQTEATLLLAPYCRGPDTPPIGGVRYRIEYRYESSLPTVETLLRWRETRSTTGLDADYDRRARERIEAINGIGWGFISPLTTDADLQALYERFKDGLELPICSDVVSDGEQ